MQASVRLEPRRRGADQHIVLASVDEGSEAWKAGLRAGQELKGISDPNQKNCVWQLDSKSSFRFVRDALRMSRNTVTLDVDTSTPPTEATVSNSKTISVRPPANSTPSESNGPENSVDVLEDILGTYTESDQDEGRLQANQTVADVLEQQYQCAVDLFSTCATRTCSTARPSLIQQSTFS